MEWAIVPSSIAAAAAVLTLVWRIRDARQGRPRVSVTDVRVFFQGTMLEGCQGWGFALTVENLSNRPDVLRDITILLTDGRPFHFGQAVARQLEPRMPTPVGCSYQADFLAPRGATVRGEMVVEFSRAVVCRFPFECKCPRADA
jgi:hypothetical protein